MSTGSPLPGAAPTPPWLLGRELPTPGPAHFPTCPVCQCSVAPQATGPEAPFSWPGCEHHLHLGCVAHMAANVATLRCPSCRAAWPPSSAEALQDACRAQGLGLPAPAPEHDTTSASHHAATAPPAPRHIMPLCCPHVFLAHRTGPRRTQHGRNCLTAIWIGLQFSSAKLLSGVLSGFASGVMPPLTKATPCFRAFQHNTPSALRTAPVR